VETGATLTLPASVLKRLQVEGEPIALDPDVGSLERMVDERSQGMALIVPFVAREALLGWMGLWPRQDEVPYTPRQRQFLTTLANQSCVALQNAELYETMKSRASELAVLNAVSTAITSSLDLDEVLQAIASSVINVVGCQKMAIYTLDEARQVVNLATGDGLSEAFVSASQAMPLSSSLRTAAIVSGQPLIVADIQSSPGLASISSLMAQEGIRAMAEAPLSGKKGAIGSLAVYYTTPHHFTVEEMELLTTLAAQAAIALENARFYALTDQALAQRVEELSAIRAVRTGQLTLVGDVTRDPDQAQIMPNVRSHLSVPIVKGERALGALVLESPVRDAFDEGQASFVSQLIEHAATAIENARLYMEAQQRISQLSDLQQFGLQVVSSLHLQAVLDAVAESILKSMQANDVHIFLYDEEKDELTYRAGLWASGERPKGMPPVRRQGLTFTVAHSGEPLVINDTLSHPLYASPERWRWGTKAIAGFPLKHAGQVLGVFNVAYTVPHTFTDDELRVLTLLGNQAATAIANARLFQQLAEGRDRLEAVLNSVHESGCDAGLSGTRGSPSKRRGNLAIPCNARPRQRGIVRRGQGRRRTRQPSSLLPGARRRPRKGLDRHAPGAGSGLARHYRGKGIGADARGPERHDRPRSSRAVGRHYQWQLASAGSYRRTGHAGEYHLAVGHCHHQQPAHVGSGELVAGHQPHGIWSADTGTGCRAL
jgi:GAF domain-containing protein